MWGVLRRVVLLGASAALCLGGQAARASVPLPGDAVQPPPNINILLYYNVLDGAGELAPVRGNGYSKNTRISADFQAIRYIHTFNVAGMVGGVQLYQVYSNFLGPQEIGIPNLPGLGSGRARIRHGDGLAQPNLGAFLFPYANDKTGTYLVLGQWFDPPIGSYDKTATLNYTQNMWTFESEAGFRTTLFGSPQGRNLSLEVWGELYIFSDNNGAGAVSPALYANDYLAYGPVRQASTAPARLHQQPEGEFRVFLPFQFYPATRATITPGFYQSLGGKQVYRLQNGATLDSGTRTEESQVFLGLSSYVSPHWQLMLNGEYDVLVHGGPVNRAVELRVATAF
ncbi:MAG: hypothetical protein P4L52_07505 [Acidocella sp.]|nr:hypothetical protein [Acidocella sp.]